MAVVAGKIESFCINSDESLIYGGNNSGEILIIDVDSFEIKGRYQANYGTIVSITIHPLLPYIATLGYDRMITIWEIKSHESIIQIARFSTRNLEVWNDFLPIVDGRGGGHPLAFHPTEKRLATKSARSALLELSFENNIINILHCTRIHFSQELVSVYYHNEDQIISGAPGSIIISENKTIINSWSLEELNIHCFEPIGENTYLIASDDRRVYKLNVADNTPILIGPRITLDDLEQVTYNKTSNRAYIAGFDRNVYEINIEDCTSKGIAFAAPFKMRWIKSLQKNPDQIILQCRNGALYKVNLPEQKIISTIKETPLALWTSDFLSNGDIVIAGDSGSIYGLKKTSTVDGQSRIPSFQFSAINSNLGLDSYTKRLIVDNEDNIYIGRTNGHLFVLNSNGLTKLNSLGSAIRDLAYSASSDLIFAALESGTVSVLSKATGEVVSKYHSDNNLPVWSLAFNEKRNILAFGEYEAGSIHLVNVTNGERLFSFPEATRPKRMKWIDDDTLLFNRFGDLLKIDCKKMIVSEIVTQLGNTIEDFVVDYENRYVVIIAYTKEITLCDLDTGQILDRCYGQCDYSKGISWVYNHDVSDRQYKLDFFIYGRSGECHFYRILDEAIFSLGFSVSENVK